MLEIVTPLAMIGAGVMAVVSAFSAALLVMSLFHERPPNISGPDVRFVRLYFIANSAAAALAALYLRGWM